MMEEQPVKLDPEFKAKWIADLRSGKYEQGEEFLYKDDKWCCLGRALDVIDPTGWCCSGAVYGAKLFSGAGSERVLSSGGRKLLGISIESEAYLVAMNDGMPCSNLATNHPFHGFERKPSQKHTFAEIADAIEKYL